MAESYDYGKRPLWQWVLIYLIVGGLIYWLIYAFVLKKNGMYGSGYQAPTTGSTNNLSPAAANKMTVTLAAENSSGESGTATLEEVDGKVVVTVSLTGFTQGVAQPAHIHVGACPGVGAIKYPLTSVVNGGSVTTLGVSLADLQNAGPLALNIHKSATEAKVYTACGALPVGDASSTTGGTQGTTNTVPNSGY